MDPRFDSYRIVRELIKINDMNSAITNVLPDGTIYTIHPNGFQTYHLNKKYHRIDGPAIIHPDGSQYWYVENKLHREDGPAVISSGVQSWYFNDVKYDVNSTEEFMTTLMVEEVHDILRMI